MNLRVGSNDSPAAPRPPAPASPPPVRLAREVFGQQEKEALRLDVAKAALTGLLAATPANTQSNSNADQLAKRAVRYADALLEALNASTAEALHARQR